MGSVLSGAPLRGSPAAGYDSLVTGLEAGPLPALANRHLTFGSQNTFRKLHPEVYSLWARVLREVPRARLFMVAEERARDRIRKAFAGHGVEGDRISFAGRASRYEYLRRFQSIDIGLDTFPFNGATTTLDSVWMGVPVVTLSGPTALQRAGRSIAASLNIAELAARTEDELVEIAVRLAADLDRLSTLRAGLRSRLVASHRHWGIRAGSRAISKPRSEVLGGATATPGSNARDVLADHVSGGEGLPGSHRATAGTAGDEHHDSLCKLEGRPKFKWGVRDRGVMTTWHPSVVFDEERRYFDDGLSGR